MFNPLKPPVDTRILKDLEDPNQRRKRGSNFQSTQFGSQQTNSQSIQNNCNKSSSKKNLHQGIGYFENQLTRNLFGDSPTLGAEAIQKKENQMNQEVLKTYAKKSTLFGLVDMMQKKSNSLKMAIEEDDSMGESDNEKPQEARNDTCQRNNPPKFDYRDSQMLPHEDRLSKRSNQEYVGYNYDLLGISPKDKLVVKKSFHHYDFKKTIPRVLFKKVKNSKSSRNQAYMPNYQSIEKKRDKLCIPFDKSLGREIRANGSRKSNAFRSKTHSRGFSEGGFHRGGETAIEYVTSRKFSKNYPGEYSLTKPGSRSALNSKYSSKMGSTAGNRNLYDGVFSSKRSAPCLEPFKGSKNPSLVDLEKATPRDNPKSAFPFWMQKNGVSSRFGISSIGEKSCELNCFRDGKLLSNPSSLAKAESFRQKKKLEKYKLEAKLEQEELEIEGMSSLGDDSEDEA